MSALTSYRRLFALTGPAYVLGAYLARLPLAMSQMGTLLLVAGVSGSYGAGGAAAGAMAVATAVASPVAGALTDRIGQRPVLLVQAVAGTVALITLVALAHAEVPWPVLAVVAAAAGAFLPQVGTMARVRWRELAAPHGPYRPALISTAFSYEGAADEASFVIGPAVVGAVVAVASPGASLLASAVLLGVFGAHFALHPTARLVTGSGRSVPTAADPLLTPALVGLTCGQLLVGMVFGSVQNGTTVLATEAGEPGLAGLLHGTLGVGSVLAGLTLVLLSPRWRLADRLPVFAGLLAALSVPLLAVHSVPALTVVLLVLGLAVAPYTITIFSLCEAVTAPRHLGTAMTSLAAATSLGYAAGSSTAGLLADVGGHPAAYGLTVTVGGLALLLAVGLRPTLHRQSRERARRL